MWKEHPSPVAFLKAYFPAQVEHAHRQGHSDEDIDQSAWLYATGAARRFEPERGIKFSTYAVHYFRAGLQKLTRFRKKLVPIHKAISLHAVDDEDRGIDPANHRRDCADPGLHLWCSDDYSEQRRCLPIRERIILYLRTVEGWVLEDVGDAMGMTRERVRQIETRAVNKLAEFRVRRQLRRIELGQEVAI